MATVVVPPQTQRTPKRAVRHKASTRARVIELYEAEWGPTAIQRILEREGHQVPSRNTIWFWTHPTKGASQAQRGIKTARLWRVSTASFAWPGIRGPEWKTGRMRRLRAAGMPCASIARVMAVDFPNDPPISSHRVRELVRNTEPRKDA